MERLQFLLTKLQEHDLDYFDEFYELTNRKVYFMAYSLLRDEATSEDIVQEVYMKFLEKPKRVKVDGNITSYLIEMSKNISLNHLKKEQRSSTEYLDEISGTNDPDFTKLEDTQVFQVMKKVLNEKEFTVVILHVVNDLKHEEISKLLKIPLGTVTWLYNSAIKKLTKGGVEHE